MAARVYHIIIHGWNNLTRYCSGCSSTVADSNHRAFSPPPAMKLAPKQPWLVSQWKTGRSQPVDQRLPPATPRCFGIASPSCWRVQAATAPWYHPTSVARCYAEVSHLAAVANDHLLRTLFLGPESGSETASPQKPGYWKNTTTPSRRIQPACILGNTCADQTKHPCFVGGWRAAHLPYLWLPYNFPNYGDRYGTAEGTPIR